MNIELAEKVLEFARAEHKDFEHDQEIFIAGDVFQGKVCKTRACIAGTAVYLSPGFQLKVEGGGYVEMVDKDGHPVDCEYKGRELLDLTVDQADDVFFCMDNEQALQRLEDLIDEAKAGS
jgi:hypothetical protein